MRLRSHLSTIIFVLTTLLGLGAFLYPFWMPALARAGASQDLAHAGDAALVLSLIVAICFAVLLVEVQAQAMSAKVVALMGVLVAINSVLRFAEVAMPGPGGLSPIFVLIVLGGYVFGGRIGFLLGALTILASALITGGVGPWMPYQMLTAGWVGMSAPFCRLPARAAGRWVRGGDILVLALFGALWGLVFGAIMNLWFWPFSVGQAGMYWEPGIGVAETLRRYALFYVVTSLVWDILRAAGNFVLILLMGGAVLRILERFRLRFDFDYSPLPVAQPLSTTIGGQPS